jgi:hypothetical protein
MCKTILLYSLLMFLLACSSDHSGQDRRLNKEENGNLIKAKINNFSANIGMIYFTPELKSNNAVFLAYLFNQSKAEEKSKILSQLNYSLELVKDNSEAFIKIKKTDLFVGQVKINCEIKGKLGSIALDFIILHFYQHCTDNEIIIALESFPLHKGNSFNDNFYGTNQYLYINKIDLKLKYVINNIEEFNFEDKGEIDWTSVKTKLNKVTESQIIHAK